jgi:hypothetical protein
MARFLAAFTALLFGCGIMALLVGLLWDRYSWQTGVIAIPSQGQGLLKG